MWLACTVFCCCNWLLGAIAFGLALASKSAADEQNIDQARSYGRASLWVSISGILLTLLLALILVVLYLTVDVEDLEDIDYPSDSSGYK